MCDFSTSVYVGTFPIRITVTSAANAPAPTTTPTFDVSVECVDVALTSAFFALICTSVADAISAVTILSE